MFCTNAAWFAESFNVLIHLHPVDTFSCQPGCFSMSWCATCRCFRMSSIIESGISTCLPLNMTPDSTASSSLNDQYGRRSLGRSFMVSGHYWWMSSFIALSFGSAVIWIRRASCFFCEKFIMAMVCRSGSSIIIIIHFICRALYIRKSPSATEFKRKKRVVKTYNTYAVKEKLVKGFFKS